MRGSSSSWSIRMIAGVLLEAGVSLASCCGCVFVLLDDGVEDIEQLLRCIYKVQALFLFFGKKL
jgi:hypothetical protein